MMGCLVTAQWVHQVYVMWHWSTGICGAWLLLSASNCSYDMLSPDCSCLVVQGSCLAVKCMKSVSPPAHSHSAGVFAGQGLMVFACNLHCSCCSRDLYQLELRATPVRGLVEAGSREEAVCFGRTRSHLVSVWAHSWCCSQGAGSHKHQVSLPAQPSSTV
jgi:hypothetical protein